MGIGMIVLVIAAVVLVVYLIRSMTVTTAQTHPATHYPQAQGAPPYATQLPAAQAAMETPRDIVRRRYASGEIDREEYLQKLKDVCPV